jgi:hypothetical protein
MRGESAGTEGGVKSMNAGAIPWEHPSSPPKAVPFGSSGESVANRLSMTLKPTLVRDRWAGPRGILPRGLPGGGCLGACREAGG